MTTSTRPYPLPPNVIEHFYRGVAGSTELPIMAYNNPKASGTDMRPDLIARVAEIDGVVAVKECSGDARRIAEILNTRGWIAGVANVAPRECVELFSLCSEGRLEEARELHARLLPLGRLDMHPKLVQYFKAAMDLVGREGGPCRPPRLELTEDERREVEEAVRALGAGVAG